MTCPQCQQVNAAGVKFCGECGSRLPIKCPSCGEINEPTRKFCGECGAQLAAPRPPVSEAPAPAPAPSAPSTAANQTAAFRDAAPVSYTPKHLAEKILTSKGALEGERKTVTVMFADVSGFTAISERLDPEDVHAIMDRVFEVILSAVHRYEGTVNQFLGDGVMALFGAPIAHEDHAPRALRAALAIQEGLVPLAADIQRVHSVEFRMRMGLNTGPVVVGAIGRDLRMDYTAVGDTTNVAARLMALAKPGQIVVSQRTQNVRDRSFVFADLGDFQVKGKTEPIRAWALTAETREGTQFEGGNDRVLTPLVGRDRELRALGDAFRRATAGAGSAVIVLGEPGCGKSRLLHEFRHGVVDVPVLELEATCASYGASIAYRPVLDLVRRYLGLAEGATSADIRRAVGEELDALGGFDEEAASLLAHFAGARDASTSLAQLSPGELRDRTVDMLCRVFIAASRALPLLLLIENVHWIDESSAEFLSRLATCLAEHRVFIVLSARPGLPPKLALPGATIVSVGGLTADDVAGMARTLLGTATISPLLVEILVDRGAGNPLYVEELLLQLRESGRIVVTGDEASLASPEIIVPSTIHDIIAARVDRLSDDLKLTLRGAAVVGRRFGVTLLSRVIESQPADVGRHLTKLHEIDFVFPAAHDPELMYSFKHALTQDVLYAGLLERRRRLLHATAGTALEELYASRVDDVVELLAYHFGASGEDEKAVDYALRAAEKTQRRWANAEALGYFESALKRLATMPDTPANRLRRVDAIVKQSEINFALGRQRVHVGALDAIGDVVEATADPPRRAAWHFWTGFFHSLTGSRPDIPIAHCQEAATIAATAGLEELRATAESCLSQVYAYVGRHADGVDAGQRALEVFERNGNVFWACRTLWGLSLATIPLGQWDASLEYCRRALEHGERVNDRRLKIVALWRTGWTHIVRGEANVGLQRCEEALALSPAPFDEMMTKAVQGYGLVKIGKADAGIALMTEAVNWLQKGGLVFTATWYSLWLADACLMIGDEPRARELATDVLPRTQEFGYRLFEGMAERIIGTSLVETDPTRAAERLAAARSIFEEVGARNEAAKALVAEAELARAAGDLDDARERHRRAVEIFQALGTLDEPRGGQSFVREVA